MLAIFFGSSVETDAFFLAFRIPNFFRRLFAEGSFSQAFIPVLSEYVNKSDKDIRLLLNQTITWLLIFLIPLTIFGIVFASYVIKIYATGFLVSGDTQRMDMATSLLQITFGYLLFISITAFFSAILNSYNKFFIASITPAWLNISFITAMLFTMDLFANPVYCLAWAVLIAGVVQMLFQIPFLIKLKRCPTITMPKKHPGIIKILKLMLPTLFAVSVNQINMLVGTQLATFLAIGSISWLNYSDRIMSLPLAIIGIAIATVAMPRLSKTFSNNNEKEFTQILSWGIKVVATIGLPATLGLFLLSNEITTTLFFYGNKMSLTDITNISHALLGYLIGLPFFMVVKILTSALFSKRMAKFSVKVGLIAVGANIIFSLLLISPMQHVGLALATSLSAVINAILLGYGLYKTGNIIASKSTIKFSLQIFASLFGMGVFIFVIQQEVQEFSSLSVFSRISYLIIYIAGAISIYFALLYVFGVRIKDYKFSSNSKKNTI
jgi:putative peptidoglycan lipid II flippase